jgi:hypothetical protein
VYQPLRPVLYLFRAPFFLAIFIITALHSRTWPPPVTVCSSDHPRTLAQLDQLVGVHLRSRPVCATSDQQVHARARTSSVPLDRTTLNGRSSVIVA